MLETIVESRSQTFFSPQGLRGTEPPRRERRVTPTGEGPTNERKSFFSSRRRSVSHIFSLLALIRGLFNPRGRINLFFLLRPQFRYTHMQEGKVTQLVLYVSTVVPPSAAKLNFRLTHFLSPLFFSSFFPASGPAGASRQHHL